MTSRLIWRTLMAGTMMAGTGVAAAAQSGGSSGSSPGAGPTISVPASPAQAGDAPTSASSMPVEQDGSLQDIVVTAQRRSQSINSVGVTITAATGDQLAQRGVSDTVDLVKVVPGLTFTPTSSNTPVYSLRGVGFFENALASSPAVSVYVDEAPLPYSTMTQGAALDLERVEVLKGPQGTLYGQNSTGGAINYIAAKPTSTWKAGFDAGFSRFNTADFGGFVSGPITPTLGLRIAARTVQGGDWQRSTTRDDELGAVDQLTGRVQLNWAPSDRVNVLLSASGWTDRSDTLAGQVVEVIPTVPALAAPGLFANYPAADLGPRDADWTPGKQFKSDSWFYAFSGRIDVDLLERVKLTSITAYQRLSRENLTDADGTNQPIVDYFSDGDIKSFSQELRLAGDFGPLNLIVGGNYSTATVRDDVPGDFRFLSVRQPIPQLPPFQFAAPNSDSKIDTYAAFLNAELQVTDQLSLIAGTRYTRSKNRYSGCTRAGDPGLALLFTVLQSALRGAIGLSPTAVPLNVGDCNTLVAPVFTATGVANPTTAFTPGLVRSELDEDNVSLRAGVNYKLPSGALLYASYNRGYKSGSFPVFIATSSTSLLPVTQERVEAYEAGFKLPLFDRAVQLNAAGFYYAYKDKQIRARFADQFFGLLETLVNVPKSRVAGGELELQARPFPGLDMSAAVTYSDTKVQRYTGFDVGSTPIDLSGSQFPYTPDLTAVADVQYTFDVGGGRQAFVGANGRYSGEAYAAFTEVEALRIRDYALLDVRAGLQSDDGAWRLTAFARNVTNQYYWNSVFRSGDTSFRQPGRPVTYGVSFSARFGS